MVSLAEVENKIKASLPDARVKVEDLTGGGDHLQATVISQLFAGQTRVKQHQLVYRALQSSLASEAIHALALKTYTPEMWETTGQSW
ncbi:BolA family transcriptional regulator [Spirulina sp. 06S082]|uniref:BolA family protein n=1 Tax=Spirulina sp. 06S082 TaxID=3110248 RepID=UPI002B203B0C|nr:BolA family transcriptional regulator [Spirulina sp. 06S082]MEA5472462.1 BolA family transcriptional regulator [Spirulina sp. 06S082]